jgi:hypothetical protein
MEFAYGRAVLLLVEQRNGAVPILRERGGGGEGYKRNYRGKSFYHFNTLQSPMAARLIIPELPILF